MGNRHSIAGKFHRICRRRYSPLSLLQPETCQTIPHATPLIMLWILPLSIKQSH
jgi:hypothetical protein